MLKLIIPIIVFASFKQPSNVEDHIKTKLLESAKCWNEGDFVCFMQTYWKSDSLKFIGSKGITYGWTNTLEQYKVGYPTAKERGTLTFSELSVNVLDDSYCFMIGKWHLSREIQDAQGHFTLLWENIDDEWVIITDHSSGE